MNIVIDMNMLHVNNLYCLLDLNRQVKMIDNNKKQKRRSEICVACI